jgi:hypothetical protein
MSDELKRQYADKLHWLEMGIPYSESETNPHEMVFSLAMQWKDVVPLAERIAELEMLMDAVAGRLDKLRDRVSGQGLRAELSDIRKQALEQKDDEAG